MNIWINVILLILMTLGLTSSRKSDYKRIIFSDFVKEKLDGDFQGQLKSYDSKVVELYNEYIKKFNETHLSRLQPELTTGSSRTITIDGNRKKELTLTTISKRRPLIFQIDDFLFEDECDHIMNLAIAEGLFDSLTSGEAIDQASGNTDKKFDDIGSFEFEEMDIDNDTYINVTEFRKGIHMLFETKMSDFLAWNLMKKTYADFNLDGLTEKWEWNMKNLTKMVIMINESIAMPTTKARVSQTQFIPQTDSNDPILLSIQDRLHKVTGLPLNLIRNSEPMQVVHYKPGGHYDCHLDTDSRYYPDHYAPCCHTSNSTDPAHNECGPCRFMTVLFYLNETEHGGETAFPVVGLDPYKNDLVDESGGNANADWCDLAQQCQKSKVIVKPKRGRAILWYNHFLNPDTEWLGATDHNSLHGGCAVHKGSKWVANNWLNAGHHKLHDFLSWAHNEIHPQDWTDEPNLETSEATNNENNDNDEFIEELNDDDEFLDDANNNKDGGNFNKDGGSINKDGGSINKDGGSLNNEDESIYV